MLSLLVALSVASTPLVEKSFCAMPLLLGRTVAVRRSPEFDRAAQAFDRAGVDWDQKRYLDAAKGFLDASARFAAAGEDANARYAWKNAAYAFEAAKKVDEGKRAFEAAAVKDPTHAAELRAAGAALDAKHGC